MKEQKSLKKKKKGKYIDLKKTVEERVMSSTDNIFWIHSDPWR